MAFNMRRLHQYLEEEGLLLAPSKSKVLCACETIGRLTERTLNAEKEIELGPGDLGIRTENRSGRITHVEKSSAAYEAGIRPGWQVKEMEGQKIKGDEHMVRLGKEMAAKKKRIVVYTNMWLGYEYITAVKLLGVDWASGLNVQYANARRRLAKAS